MRRKPCGVFMLLVFEAVVLYAANREAVFLLCSGYAAIVVTGTNHHDICVGIIKLRPSPEEGLHPENIAVSHFLVLAGRERRKTISIKTTTPIIK